MTIEPSGIAGVELIGSADAEFAVALRSLLGGDPGEVLHAALPFSVIVGNATGRAIALVGVRFDMLGGTAKPYSVVHYANTLRNPDSAALTPGARRFVCAEQLYTELVLRKESTVDRRGPMNLARLRQAIEIRASVDCVAFDDGLLAGPDSLNAFDRFAREREAETALVKQVLGNGTGLEQILADAAGGADTRSLGRLLLAAFESGGPNEVRASARSHRLRIALHR